MLVTSAIHAGAMLLAVSLINRKAELLGRGFHLFRLLRVSGGTAAQQHVCNDLITEVISVGQCQ